MNKALIAGNFLLIYNIICAASYESHRRRGGGDTDDLWFKTMEPKKKSRGSFSSAKSWVWLGR